STDGSGAYGFTGLCAGTYTVEVDETTLPPDFVATPVDQGDDDTADSDPSPISVTLKYDITKNFTLDFGYNSPCTGTLGDYVWHDLNRDGIQDSGESGLEGIKVILKDAGGMVIAEARTDPHGYYGFNGLCAGDYSVEVDETTLPPDFVATPVDQGGDDTADSDPSPVFVTLTNDTTSNPTLDFGYNSPCTGVLGDFVWQDENRNGIQDAGESGLEGIKVILKDAEGRVLAEVTTDADGFYLFPGLCAGEYKVAVDESTLPSGIEPSPCDVPGGDDEKDSDCSPVSMGLTGNNDENRSVDFGYMPEECGECEGKVTELTLKYNGSEAAVVKVKQKKEGTIFSKRLNPGDTFTITGADRKGTLGTEIYIYVGCRLNTKIHTSCSQPIGPGLVSGDFEVLSGFSLKGGKLCPVNLPPPDDECGCEGKVTVLTLKYNGSDVAVVKVKQKDEGTIFWRELDPGNGSASSGEGEKISVGAVT
ncbi:MAG: hypothetical protein GY737_21535, partial [Desulfobacteraceae bacterium]|nr:hypothetical protein [Desulfobacteraceae bacterium]